MERQSIFKNNKFAFATALLFLGVLFYFITQTFNGKSLFESKKPHDFTVSDVKNESTTFDQAATAWKETEKLKNSNHPEVNQKPKVVENNLAQNLNSDDLKKYNQLLQILDAKNDNDPRLDSELKDLSLELHQALIQLYSDLPAEQRNEKGTIAFLLGRDLKSEKDLAFMKNLFQEKPNNSQDEIKVAIVVIKLIDWPSKGRVTTCRKVYCLTFRLRSKTRPWAMT